MWPLPVRVTRTRMRATKPEFIRHCIPRIQPGVAMAAIGEGVGPYWPSDAATTSRPLPGFQSFCAHTGALKLGALFGAPPA